AVDSEHLAADEALAIAQIEHLTEEAGDVIAQAGDEDGDGGVVQNAVATEGNEGYMFAAGAFDAARTDDALTVGEEDDLEQHARRKGAGAGEVVPVAGIEAGQVDLVVDQMVQGILEGARQQLPFEINGNEARAVVDRLVAGH